MNLLGIITTIDDFTEASPRDSETTSSSLYSQIRRVDSKNIGDIQDFYKYVFNFYFFIFN
jgi:hypothetical protein